MKAFWHFIVECFTDVRGRPEPKMIIGIPLIIYSVVYLVTEKNLQNAIYIGGLGTTLVGGTAVFDSFNDYRSPPSDGHQIPPGE
jgi:hypothetical protein